MKLKIILLAVACIFFTTVSFEQAGHKGRPYNRGPIPHYHFKKNISEKHGVKIKKNSPHAAGEVKHNRIQ